MKLDKNCLKQADLTVFAFDPRGARAPFAPPDTPVVTLLTFYLRNETVCDIKLGKLGIFRMHIVDLTGKVWEHDQAVSPKIDILS